jgi:putative aldouronate transport system permease protein
MEITVQNTSTSYQKALKYRKSFNSFLFYVKKDYIPYLFVIPGLVFYIMFIYMPMVGIISAFQNYNPIGGIFKSRFIWFDNFKVLFMSSQFLLTVKNTIVINLLKLVFNSPVPIIFALLLNEVINVKFKRVNQTISYLPHFVSWIVVAGLWYRLLSPNNGVLNNILFSTHIIKDSILFIGESKFYYWILVLQDLWKDMGFISIFYIAALSSIDPELYQAAKVDGANHFQKIIYISIPGILTTIMLLFILTLSNIMNANFEQMITMINPQVMKVGDVIDTYVFRILMSGYSTDIGIGAALSMFKSGIGIFLFLTANSIMKKRIGQSFV